jgi:tripartite-type tricarboxylate transporter receptor subunit TctC
MKKLLLSFAILFAHSVWAQNITAVVTQPVGGGIDNITRAILKRYDDLYGTASVVVNKPGAEGVIGLNHLHSLPATTTGIIAPSTGHVLNYSQQEFSSLIPLVETVRQPWVLIVRKDLPADNWDEFVSYARANPGKINTGIAAKASYYPWLVPLLERNKITLNFIPTGTSNPHVDVASGVLDSFWTTPASVLGTGLEERFKIIAVTSNVAIPGVDPKIMSGNNPRLGNIHLSQGFYTTSAVDPEQRKLISARLIEILHSSWATENISRRGAKAGGSPDHLVRQLKQDREVWQKLRTE